MEKTVIKLGEFGWKPSEEAEVLLELDQCPVGWAEFHDKWFVVGDCDCDVGKVVERCIGTMDIGETSRFNVADVQVIITLKAMNHKGFVYDWAPSLKYTLALKHKAKGQHLFEQQQYKQSAVRFFKSLQLIQFIPIPVDQPTVEIDGVALAEINDLKEKLYNNLASCFFKKNHFAKVIQLCSKVLEFNGRNLKALYKLGVAYEAEKDWDRSMECFVTLEKEEPGAWTEHLQRVGEKVKQEQKRVDGMMKRMVQGLK